MTTCAVYCRISRDREGAGVGVERQEKECRELALSLGWTVGEVYTDNDISASQTKRPRPAYNRMLAALGRGEYAAVVAWHTDRLHRRTMELEAFIDVCEPRKVDVRTVRAGSLDLSTASGRMVARMLGAAARHESEHMGERIRAQKARAASQGQPIGGARAYGYERDGVTVRDDEAARILDATRRVINGESVYSVAKTWADAPTVRGGTWTETNLRRVLLRPRNAGLYEHRGEVTGAATWPAIVPRDEWEACRSVLAAPKQGTYQGSRSLRWLGSGLYLCGVCDDGTVLRSAGRSSGRRASGEAVYRCRTGLHNSVKAEPLDEAVRAAVEKRLTDPELAAWAPRPDGTSDVAALRSRVAGLRARLDETAEMYASGEFDRAQYNRTRLKITADLDAATAELTELASGSPLAGVLEADEPLSAFDAAEVAQQRAIVDTLMTVTISAARRGRLPGGAKFDYGRVRIEWR